MFKFSNYTEGNFKKGGLTDGEITLALLYSIIEEEEKQ